jgi:aspartyl-tRNA(Asn)/glutamyl-tRNA(Gln) amidotransferase subunit B
MKFLTLAVHFEVERQIALLESGKTVEQETRLFDSSRGVTKSMRSKEDAQDYRYFPEPDLPPLILEQSRIDAIRATIPELPDAKCNRLQQDYDLPHYDASLITSENEIAIFYEKALESVNCDKDAAKMLSSWIIGELFALLNKHNKSISDNEISPEHMGELINLIKTDVISGKMAKDVLEIMWESKKSPVDIVEERGWKQITSEATIENFLREVLSSHADKVAEYKNGKDKLFGFFIGQAMKKTQGKANPQVLNEVLNRLLSE